jgi:transposase
MVTDRDIVCKGLAQDNFDANRATARDVMAPGIHCCRDDDDLAKAVQHMEKLKVRRLPVINKSKRMVGILSLGDISHSAPGAVLAEWAKLYCERNLIERFFNLLKHFRAIATRYDKLARNFLAGVQLAAVTILLN